MNAAEVHLHHMARRHHATMKKLDGLREKFTGFSMRAASTVETGAGAWVGGLIDGKYQTSLVRGVSLVFAGGLILMEGLNFAGERDSVHYGNVGRGFLSSSLARAGYRFGQRKRAEASS